ncbi:MAG: hypothetical protein R2827_08280 [Bdellovibrionales bacterium]
MSNDNSRRNFLKQTLVALPALGVTMAYANHHEKGEMKHGKGHEKMAAGERRNGHRHSFKRRPT